MKIIEYTNKTNEDIRREEMIENNKIISNFIVTKKLVTAVIKNKMKMELDGEQYFMVDIEENDKKESSSMESRDMYKLFSVNEKVKLKQITIKDSNTKEVYIKTYEPLRG